MSYKVAADLLEQMFPVDAGTDPETLRRHTGLSVICMQKVPLRKVREINVLRHAPGANQLKYQ
jgi:hypothetical protein